MWKVIDKIGLFLQNLFTALKFAAFDYDVTLRRTKTPKERIIIWILIFSITIGLIYGSLLFLGYLIRSIANKRFVGQIFLFDIIIFQSPNYEYQKVFFTGKSSNEFYSFDDFFKLSRLQYYYSNHSFSGPKIRWDESG